MRYEFFVYPPTNEALLAAWGGAFESAFVLLHPFVQVPDELSWRATQSYPTDEQIRSEGRPVSWIEVAAEAGLGNCSRLAASLLTTIGAIQPELADPEGRDRLSEYLRQRPIWMPTEGRFEPLLQSAILETFEQASCQQLIHVPEFPGVDRIEDHSPKSLREGNIGFPEGGTLVAPDASFLFTVEWESFFTLFYGPRKLVEAAARRNRMEGFFATPTTEHAWFNYVLGCATVTVTPEVWVL